MAIFSARALRILPALCLALAMASACTPKIVKPKPGAGGGDGIRTDVDETLATSAPNVDVEEARIRGKEFRSIQELKAIYFDFDSYALNDAAREALKENAEYLSAHPDLETLIEGHCDQRGTNEYNLALGQKRAKETRDYLMRLGVPGKSVGTISFGKERPACDQETEECWAKNRRAETKIRAQTASNHTTPRQ
ncbi:MAG: peptidoglycan-associated lipoprotein Pal [Elusimicrobia bacterium]|nr:peptidoglycan-associated lipoprotein Pal [Elusimicrobiota bacterium]